MNTRNLWFPFSMGCFVSSIVTVSFSRLDVLWGVSFNWAAFSSVSENRLSIPYLIQEVENACMHSHVIANSCVKCHRLFLDILCSCVTGIWVEYVNGKGNLTFFVICSISRFYNLVRDHIIKNFCLDQTIQKITMICG